MKTKIIFATLVAATSIAAMPAVAQDRYDFSGGRPGGPEFRLVGRGVPLLDAPLRETGRGRAFVMRNFDFNHDGRIDPREADAANRAFEGFAGPDRGRFDWDARDRDYRPGPGGPGPRPYRPDHGVVVDQPVPYDRGAMHGYGFRQTPRGAAMTLSGDVLFQTDSDVLRPGAVDRLRPLAAYLRGNPGTRVAIDGYTDARGSDAHNQALSERRAASVQSAFDAMGVTRARFAVAGHGERDPVATNATSEGQRLNRRVEVTLLGQRADRF